MIETSNNRTKRNGCFRVFAVILAAVGLTAAGFSLMVARGYAGKSLLRAAAEQFPANHDLLKRLSAAAANFVQAWPLTPWVLAAILFALIFSMRYLAEDAFDLFTQDISFRGLLAQVLIFLPVALIWVWLFAGIVSTTSIVVYFVSYLVINYVAAVAGAGRP